MPAEPCITWLKALADETRWSIVRELLVETLTVNGLVERLDVPQYNVSKHVKILRDAGIIEGKKHGREMECKVATAFRRRLKENQNCLDLGCCTFRFDLSSPKK
ncbi:MAG: winged helix-turn-helix transcriptional regulator [Verrucomicrobia bacterium]|nr:winged helix-turn-helix transcriptional regulator [Verrucomicrobiota bacterium]